jgi:SLT domain-containing protein
MNFDTDFGEQVGSHRPLRHTLIVTSLIVLGLMTPALSFAASAYVEDTAPDLIDKTRNDYGEMVSIAAMLHDYDEKMILAVIVVESEGQKNARSHAGAQGLMQLMPGTAKSMGAKNPNEPFQNILAGTKYLKQLENRYGFDSHKEALVAYNMGPTRAKRWLSQYDADNYGYVKNVMHVYNLLVEEERDTRRLAILADKLEEKGSASNEAKPLLTRPRLLSMADLALALPRLGRNEPEQL